MKKVLLASAMIASLGTAAAANGIAPVTSATGTDVVVGTAAPAIGLNAGLIAAGIVIIGVGIALGDSADGSN